MPKLINPQMTVKVFAESDIEITNSYMEFDIAKDLDDEANEAELTIYNLNENTRNMLARSDMQSPPVEIYLTPAGLTDSVRAFKGEMETIKNSNMRPGYETYLHCTSQQDNHRSHMFSKTYKAGTPRSVILEELIGPLGINLPRGRIDTLPSSPITLSQSFSGPSFQILKYIALDIGMNAYILDGTVNLTSIYETPAPTVKVIDSNILLAQPQETSRVDAVAIEQRTIVETTSIDPFRKIKKKKKTKKKKQGPTDYVEYDTVDKEIKGMDFTCICQPDVNPDMIVSTNLDGYSNKLYRVTDVNHYGNNESFDDWTTDIVSDEYDDATGGLSTLLDELTFSLGQAFVAVSD
ncbi:MAG: hypothetical protein GY847_28830 [Proteobacteria bacterium]|nr:hypothetical protein [Pseudomonadota bacterium]